jgi:23S rRNA (guanine2445-N2)-methyltransferase
MFEYQKTGRYFAQVSDDIKDIAEEELLSLGARETRPGYRVISFAADHEALYAVNFHSRLINRVLAPLISFDCHSDKYLYNRALQIRWDNFLDTSMTFAIFASVSNSSIRHSRFAALRLKDAIVDYFQKALGGRPSIDTKNPDVWFNLYINNDKAVISLDTSGGSLHRRGYRVKSVQAPMIETLAAAIIHHSGWDGSVPLYDPFCGSGTLLCEAYMRQSNTPAGILRPRFGFERMPDFNNLLWHKVKRGGMKRINPVPEGMIHGSDISSEAVKASIHNCSLIGADKVIRIEKKDVFDIDKIQNKVIVCNPPYGIRMAKADELSAFYKKYGDFLKKRCVGSSAYIYFGERQYIKEIGLKPSWKRPLSNGGLDGRLVKFELY